jgi:hypothetical protein
MHRSGVKKEAGIIFNCSFGCSKTGKIEEFLTENGLCGIYDLALTMGALSIVAGLRVYTGY